MSYYGIGPASFTNNLTNVQILDDIKAGFNGSTTTFNLTSNSIPFHAVSDRALMVILGGVIQAPGVDYTINLAQITFTTAPISGLTFYARNIYGLNALNAVNDGIVGPYSLTTGGPTWDTSGNITISGNLTVQGSTTTIQSTTLDVLDKDIKIASNQSTNAGIDTAGLLWGTTAVKLKYYNNGGTNPGLNIEGTNVGIGTTAPTEKLHVTGTIKVGPNDTATRSGSVKIGGAGVLSYSDNHGSSGNVATVVLENSYGAANSDIHVKQRGDFEVQNLAGHAILRVDTAWTNASVNSGSVYLNYKSGASGSSVETKLETTATGVEVTGGIKLNQTQSTINLDTSDGSDNKYLSIHGGGSASQSRGAGISFYGNEVTNHQGRLQLLAGNSGNTNGVIQFHTGGSERLRITSVGTVNIGDADHVDDEYLGSTLKIQKDQNSVTRFTMRNEDSGSGSAAAVQIGATGNSWMLHVGSNANNSNAFTIRVDGTSNSNTGTEKLKIDTTGHITPGAAGTQDLGSAAKEFRNLYLGDRSGGNGGLTLGSDQDMIVYHDNIHGYVSNRKANLYLEAPTYVQIASTDTNGSAQQTSARFLRGGGAEIYHTNTVKLATTSKGITVTGEVVATQDYPNYRPTLDFNFTAVKKLDPRISFQRASCASYTDEKGLVRIVGDNVPRFDHDSETGESKGLLIEEARTSRLTQSTGNDSYGHYKQTDRGETIKGPDGVENSAREYTVNSDGGTGGSTTVWANEAVGIANPTCVSCFVKITRGTTMAFRIYDNNNNQDSQLITISGGYITDGSYATVSQSDPGGTEGTTSFERYPNGWVKVKWEGVSGNANATSYIQLYIYDHANSNGTNIGYAIWGFQVENGNVCTSTIPKPTTVAVSRGADMAVIDGQEFIDTYSPNEGSFIIDASVDDLAVSNQAIFGAEKESNRSGWFNMIGYRVGGNSSGKAAGWYMYNGGSAQGYMSGDSSGSVTAAIPFKAAYKYKYNDFAFTCNGGTVVTDTAGPTVDLGSFDRFVFGSYHYDAMVTGYIRRVTVYPKALPNSQLVTLTS